MKHRLTVVSPINPPARYLVVSVEPTEFGLPYHFGVNYSDDIAIDIATLGDGDLQIHGPAGTVLARLVSATPSAGGASVLATYEVTSPLGSWAPPDNGTYTVSIVAGEVRDSHGNSLETGTLGAFNVNVVAPIAGDLVPSYFGLMPKTMLPGEKRSAAVRVSNRGMKSIPSTTITTRLYLSSDPKLDNSDIILGFVGRRKPLSVNGADLVIFPLTTPKVAVTGKYYFLARADAIDAVLERDERNNVVASTPVTIVAPSSDLSVALTGKIKPSWKPGQAMAFGMKVTNAGPSDAAGTGVLRAYFSTNPVLDTSDQLVLTSNLSLKLKSKASGVFNRSLKIPAELAKGKVYLLLALEGSTFGDRNAANNRVAIPLQIT